MLLPDELDIIVDGLLADVRKVRIMFPQVVANTTAGNGGETDKKGCDGLLVGMELVMPFFLAEGLPRSLGIGDVVPYYGTHQDDGLSAQC